MVAHDRRDPRRPRHPEVPCFEQIGESAIVAPQFKLAQAPQAERTGV
jgi:hypothetical protein